jgi:hypothetical protein
MNPKWQKSPAGTRQGKLGLVWKKRKKISQIINDYLYLPFFLFDHYKFVPLSDSFMSLTKFRFGSIPLQKTSLGLLGGGGEGVEFMLFPFSLCNSTNPGGCLKGP